eukprot:1515532-Rhodomonas_salina.1
MYRPEDTELGEEGRRRLLGCKGEIVTTRPQTVTPRAREPQTVSSRKSQTVNPQSREPQTVSPQS